MLRFILELETYSRGEKFLANSNDYVSQLYQMNAEIFLLYLEHLTAHFFIQLKQGNTDDLLAGVKNNVTV